MRRSLLVAIVTAACLVLTVEPANAGGVFECGGEAGEGDTRIRKVDKPFKFDGVYVAADQEITLNLDVGEKAKLDVRVRNDTGSSETLVVEGGASGMFLEMKYLRDGQNITEKVTGDGKGFANIGPDESTPAVRVKITYVMEPPGTGVFTNVTGRTADAPTFDEDECTGDSVLPLVPNP